MKALSRTLLFVVSLVILLLAGCSGELNSPADLSANPSFDIEKDGHGNGYARRAKACLEIEWPGGNGSGAPTDSRIAQVSFNVREASNNHPARGKFKYQVLSTDGALHREITVAVNGVVIDPEIRKVWFTGIVVADSKGCEGLPGGGPGGGHDEGCSGDDGDACSDEGHDTGHDGGCSGTHDDGGGCSDSSHVEGGCSGEDHADGCSGEDHTDGENPPQGGGSSGHQGASGRFCRVGQVLVAKSHDGGLPGVDLDKVSWKWFLPDNQSLPLIEDFASWSHLCQKSITDGGVYIKGLDGDENDDEEEEFECYDGDDEECDDEDCDHGEDDDCQH